jgi:hypothetical protein
MFADNIQCVQAMQDFDMLDSDTQSSLADWLFENKFSVDEQV